MVVYWRLKQYYGKNGHFSFSSRHCKRKARGHRSEAEAATDPLEKIDAYKKCFISSRSSNYVSDAQAECSNCQTKPIMKNHPNSVLRCSNNELEVFNPESLLSDQIKIQPIAEKFRSYQSHYNALQKQKEIEILRPISEALDPVTGYIVSQPDEQQHTLKMQAKAFFKDHIGVNFTTRLTMRFTTTHSPPPPPITENQNEFKGLLQTAANNIQANKRNVMSELKLDKNHFISKIWHLFDQSYTRAHPNLEL